VTALVDISNYVMFEYGRPSHIFDLDKIHGGLDVRWGQPGEQLKLLNGNTVAVDGDVGVIADNEQVESLAFKHADGIPTVGRRAHVPAEPVEGIAERFAHQAVVVSDEHDVVGRGHASGR
jgi:hypothetical protein